MAAGMIATLPFGRVHRVISDVDQVVDEAGQGRLGCAVECSASDPDAGGDAWCERGDCVTHSRREGFRPVPLWEMYQRDMTFSTGFVGVTTHLEAVLDYWQRTAPTPNASPASTTGITQPQVLLEPSPSRS